MRAEMWKKILFGLIVLLLPVAVTYRMSGTYAVSEWKSIKEERYIVSGQEKIPLEEYLTGAVAYYMPLSYEDEAYKAMAVVLRTHIVKKMGHNSEIGEELLDIRRCRMEEMQVSFGEDFTHNYERYQTAVQMTAGEVLCYKEELIEPYFHQVSAGMTNAVPDCPYLHSVESRTDMQAENYLSLKTVPIEEFVSGLEEAGGDMEEVRKGDALTGNLLSDIILVMRSGEYVDYAEVYGKQLPASGIQEVFSLPSTAFRFEEYEDKIRILSKGIGHGAGMSLYGADAMAKAGKSYREILTYYYTDIIVSDV